MPEFKPNTLYYGDNLQILQDFPSECVDLIYLDPPFNSNRNYNVLFKESAGVEAEAQIQAFEDTWHWGIEGTTTWDTYNDIVQKQDDVGKMLQAFVQALGHNDVTAYLTMMAPRLVELRRLLKPTGSIYLHCDPTASHYLKAVMDAVFGAVNFKNEIIWRRTGSHNSARRYGPIHDVILFYSKAGNSTFNVTHSPYSKGHIGDYFKKEDAGGQYWTNAITGAGTRHGESGRPWRGFNPTSRGRHWAIPGRISEQLGIADLPLLERLERMYAAGFVILPQDGSSAMPTYKQYLKDSPGLPVQDIWAYQPHSSGVLNGTEDGIDEDVRWLSPYDKERLGYQTQKPEALLERIISASSNEGDVVLDPFCGCGTAVVAAHRLKRKWIGIDITYLAVDLMKNRLQTTFPGDFKKGVHIDGEPADEAAALALAEKDKYQFQFWAVAKLGGTSRGGQNKKGADQGVDGVIGFPEVDSEKSGKAAHDFKQVIISVKGGNTGPSHVRDLIGTVDNEGAAIGVLVTIKEPTRGMIDAASSAGVYESNYTKKSHPKIQIITAGDIVHGTTVDMPPLAGLTQYQAAPRAKRGKQSSLGI